MILRIYYFNIDNDHHILNSVEQYILQSADSYGKSCMYAHTEQSVDTVDMEIHTPGKHKDTHGVYFKTKFTPCTQDALGTEIVSPR